MNKVSADIRQLTTLMETQSVRLGEVHTLLLRAMLEIDKLEQEVRVLNDKIP